MDDFLSAPAGSKRVIIEPSRSGIGEAIFLTVQDEVNGIPAQNPDTGIFVPRTDAEKINVINAINEKRKSMGLSEVTTEVFDYNNNRFIEYSNARFAAVQEGQKRADPYKFFVNKWANSTSKDAKNKEGYSSGWDKILNPIGVIKNKAGEFIKDIVPKRRSDFIMYGDVIGGTAGMVGPGKLTGGIVNRVMNSSPFKVGAGSTLGGGGMSAFYDVMNELIRKTQGIPNPTDTEDPGMRALVEMRNTAAFTAGAAGLGTVAATLRPILGKAIFGLGKEAKKYSDLATIYDVPIGISIASSGQGAIAAGAKSYGRVIGLFPFIGNIMRQRQLMSEAKLTKAIDAQTGDLGYADDFYREQYKLMSKNDKAKFMADLKDQGYDSLDAAIEGELRVNGYAPIQHMTDVGTFMFDAAKARYQKFAYINDMLYDDFEKKALKISKPFINTNNTKQVAQVLKDRLAQMQIQTTTYEQFVPTTGKIDDFITKTLATLPEYITPLQLRGLQREINALYGEMVDKTGNRTFSGSSMLADARKALTTDLNNFALWRQDMPDAEKVIAESAKKSLLRANDVFSKMAPLYKSPAAKKFKFVDENMFSAGPDLPGYFYSDELFNIIARKGITPKTVADIEELVGPAAFASSVRTWMDKGFKNALSKQPVDYYETIINEAGKEIKVPVTQMILDPDQFLKNIGYGEPGFEAMIERTGRNGAVVKENIELLTDLLRKTQSQTIPFASQLISRRLVLGGVRSGLKTFSFGMASGAAGGAAGGPMGAMSAVTAGLLARFTADFLSSPQALKNYTRIVDPATKDIVRKNAYAQLLKNFYEQKMGNKKSEGLEEFPDEFKTYKGALNNPDGFFKWLFGSGYKSSMDAVNDQSKQQYNESRFGDNIDIGLSQVQERSMEENAADMELGNLSQVSPDIPLPNVRSGSEDIFSESEMTMAGPVSDAPLNPQQRIALAGGNLDEAIALGNRRV